MKHQTENSFCQGHFFFFKLNKVFLSFAKKQTRAKTSVCGHDIRPCVNARSSFSLPNASSTFLFCVLLHSWNVHLQTCPDTMANTTSLYIYFLGTCWTTNKGIPYRRKRASKKKTKNKKNKLKNGQWFVSQVDDDWDVLCPRACTGCCQPNACDDHHRQTTSHVVGVLLPRTIEWGHGFLGKPIPVPKE